MTVHDTSVRGPVRAAGAPAAVPPVLDLARRLTLPPLREAVGRLHPALARVGAYHFGWCDADGAPLAGGGGKFLRAGLVLLSARAVGGDPAGAVPGAVAVELVHNFSLVHDDIMDADERRRGRPTAWVVYGPAMATLAGDALTALALRQLAGLAPEYERRVDRLLVDALNEMIGGQSADLDLERRSVADATLTEYLDASRKTTALLSAAAAIGAVLGGGTPEQVEALGRASRHLGLAWQMANDVEDIWGDPAVTGKPAFGDLRRSQKTLPVILAVRSGTEAGGLLAASLARGTPPAPAEGDAPAGGDVSGSGGPAGKGGQAESHVPAGGDAPAGPSEETLRGRVRLIERAGGREQAERLSRRHLATALDLLGSALPAGPARTELAGLFRFIVTRSAAPLAARTGGADEAGRPGQARP